MINFTDPAHSDLGLPRWAQPLGTARRAATLLQLATEILTHRYEKPAVDRDLGQLTVEGVGTFGLTTMAHSAAQLPESQWRTLAYDMISTLDQHGPEQIAAMLSDWDQIRDLARVRVFPGQIDSMSWTALGHNLGPTSHLGMGLQLDRSMVKVPLKYAREWDIGLEHFHFGRDTRYDHLPGRAREDRLSALEHGFDRPNQMLVRSHVFGPGTVGEISDNGFGLGAGVYRKHGRMHGVAGDRCSHTGDRSSPSVWPLRC